MDTIFIVDDELEMCLSLSEILTELNYKVEYSVDPVQAFEKIKANPPQFVITDIQMPGTNGLNLLKQINTFIPSIHVIIMTGSPTVEKAVDAIWLCIESGTTAMAPRVGRHVETTTSKACTTFLAREGATSPSNSCGFVIIPVLTSILAMSIY